MKKLALDVEKLESRVALSVSPVVAVIDSGANVSHPYISSRLWTNPGEIAWDNIDNDNNGYVDDIHGWNFVDNNNDISDGYGHGTAVAGLAASNGSDSLMILKFQDSKGLGYTGDAIKAIDYALMMKKDYGVNVSVINNSWGGTTGYSSILYNDIVKAYSEDVLFVVGAGNSAVDTDVSPRYPGCYNVNNIISVGAVGYDYSLAGYSNYGKNSVDLGTFGNSVYSTTSGGDYGYFAGTSFAAPIVSSAAAYVKNLHNDWNVDSIKSYIFSTVEQKSWLTDKFFTGGVLNSSLVFSLTKPVVTPVVSVAAPVATKSAVVSQPSISVPVVQVEILTLKSLKGWAFDSELKNRAVKISVVINDRVVKTVAANLYRGDLKNKVGSSYHGFNVKLNPWWFHKGENSVMVKVGNKALWSGNIHK